MKILDITQLTIEKNKLINGTYYVRMRYRDTNMEWSEWSDTRQFTVEGSIAGKPSISITDTSVTPGEAITIDYKYAPEGQNAWIASTAKEKNRIPFFRTNGNIPRLNPVQ